MRIVVIFMVFFALVLTGAAAMAQGTPAAGTQATKPTPTTAQDYFTQAREAFAKNDLDAAIFNGRMAISMKPDFLDAHYMLGKAYLLRAAKANRLAVRDYGMGSPQTRYLKQYVKGRSDLTKAIQQFEAAIALSPKDIDAMLNLAIAQDNLGKEKEAIKTYEKTIELDPVGTHARDAYSNMGLAYASLEKYKKAKASYEAALKIDPTFTPAKLNLQRLMTLKPKLK